MALSIMALPAMLFSTRDQSVATFSAAGDRWLIDLTRKATTDWLNTTHPVLDYANAMVPARAADAQANWQEHVDGKPQYGPPIPPLAPAKFTGGLWLVERSRSPNA